MVLSGMVYDLHVDGTTLVGPVTLTVPANGPRSGPQAAMLGFYDTTTRRWRPVDATYDKVTGALTASMRHLSIWSALRLDTGKVLTGATDLLKGFIGAADAGTPPSCPRSGELAAHNLKVTSDKGDLVKWCAGVSDTGRPLLRVADNRRYAIEAEFPAGWSARTLGPLDPIIDRIVTSVTHLLSPVGEGNASVIIPGGHTVEFTAPVGASGLVRAVPSGEGYLVDAFVYGVDTLGMTFGDIPGVPPASKTRTAEAISAAFTAKSCVTAIDAIEHNDVSSAHAVGELFRSDVSLAINCLGEQWRIAYGLTGFVATFYTGVALWLVDGVKLVIDGLRGAVDSALYWRSYRIALVSTAVPVLGHKWGAYQDGYGDPRPTTIFNGGDPTGLVKSIRWHSWGGSTATGDGTALYAPGIVADGSMEPAKVVAFNLGTCRGKPAYRAIEWYFPQHGGHFDGQTYIDACTGAYVGQ
jgi:hypothetical protein